MIVTTKLIRTLVISVEDYGWPGTTDFGSDDSTSDKKKIYFNLVLWSNFQDDFA